MAVCAKACVFCFLYSAIDVIYFECANIRVTTSTAPIVSPASSNKSFGTIRCSELSICPRGQPSQKDLLSRLNKGFGSYEPAAWHVYWTRHRIEVRERCSYRTLGFGGNAQDTLLYVSRVVEPIHGYDEINVFHILLRVIVFLAVPAAS